MKGSRRGEAASGRNDEAEQIAKLEEEVEAPSSAPEAAEVRRKLPRAEQRGL